VKQVGTRMHFGIALEAATDPRRAPGHALATRRHATVRLARAATIAAAAWLALVAPAAAQDGDDSTQSGGAQAQPGDGSAAAGSGDGSSATSGAAPANVATEEEAATEEAAEEAAPEPPPPPKKIWRNSLFMFTPSMTVRSFNPGAQLSYDPTVSLNIRLMPRLYLTDKLFLRVRQDLNIELTDSNWDSRARQPLLADTVVDLIMPGAIAGGGFVLTGGLRVTLPTSIRSQYENLIMGNGIIANASYQLPGQDVLHLTLLFDIIWQHFWHATNVGTPFDSDRSAYGGSCVTGLPDGINATAATSPCNGLLSSVRDSLLFGPTLLWVPTDKLNISATYYWFPRWGRGLAEPTIDTLTGGQARLEDSRTHLRAAQFFGVSVAYDVLTWMNLSLNYQTFTDQLNPNGTLRNPVWGPDTTVSLTAVITLDALYKELFEDAPPLTPEQLRRIRMGQAQGPRNRFNL
jgi:hypothetical protein